jgi:peroxiredoxin
LPSLESLHQHFRGKPFTLLAVDVGEEREVVQKFVRSRGLSFKFLLDEDGQVSARYGIRGHPMKFLVDMKGNLIGIARGYNKWDTEEMKSLIQMLMSS